MTDDERPPRSERVAPESVHLRRPPATIRSSSVRLGGIIVIGLLIAAGSLLMRGGPDVGEIGESADPSASTTALESGSSPDSTADSESSAGPTPSPAVPSKHPTSQPPPDPPEPLRPPARNGDVIATIPEGDADDLSAQVEVLDQCLDDPDTALVTFRVGWDAASPIDRTHGDIGIDYVEATTENELGADGRFDLTGSYDRTVNVRVGRDLWVQLSFFREMYDLSVPDEDHGGFWLADAKGGAMFDPQNPCP